MKKLKIFLSVLILFILFTSSASAKVTGNYTYSDSLVTNYYPINGSGHNS